MHNSTSLIISGFGLLAALSWGISNFMGAKASKLLGPIGSSFLVNTIGTVLYALFYTLFLRQHSHLTNAAFIYGASSGIVFTIGALAFFKGLKAGPVSIVAPLSGTYPLITLLVALLAFHAHITLGQLGGILLVMLGALAAAELLGTKRRMHGIGSGPAWAFLTAIGWGAAYALLNQSIARVGWQMASLIEFVFVVVGLLIFMPFVKGDEDLSFHKMCHMAGNKFILTAGAIQLIGMLALNLGLAKEGGSGAVVTAISSCCPAITMLLAFRHLDEKIALLPLAGALTTVLGVIVLSF